MAESELAAQSREAAREHQDNKSQQHSHQQHHNQGQHSSGSLVERSREVAQEERSPTYWRDLIEQQRKDNGGDQEGNDKARGRVLPIEQQQEKETGRDR